MVRRRTLPPLRGALSVFAVALALFAFTALASGEETLFRLVSPSSSHLLAEKYPRERCAFHLRIAWEKPGIVLDTVGINGAPAGSFALAVDAGGRVSFRVYEPAKQSAVRHLNGWHEITSSTALAKGVEGLVAVEVAARQVRLYVNGVLERAVDLTVRLSGQPVWVGDFPGDDHWGASYNIHPAMTGSVRLRYVGDLASAPSMTGPDDGGVSDAAAVTKTFGPAGGALALSDGTRVEIPAGALKKETPVTVRTVDPGEHFSKRDDRVRRVVECTAPVRRFSAPVKIRFPLPGDAGAEAAQAMQAGYIDTERGMKVHLPCSFSERGGRKDLVVETDHFTSFFFDGLKNLFSSPPASRTVANVPYYSQGSSTYCWAACTQMICEAVTESDTPGEIWDIIGRMQVSPDGLSSFTAAFSSTWSTLMRERTRVSPDLHYWQANMTRLRKYIYEQIGFYGHPVLYSSATLQHAVVIVGYDTTPSEPAFIVNDPGIAGAGSVAYRRVTASQLRLGNEESLTNPVVTAVIDKDVSARPAVRVSLASQCFGVKTEAGGADHLWTWDHACARGYRFRIDPLAAEGADIIPGTIGSAKGKTFIEVSNATPSEQALSCDYSIWSKRSEVARKHAYVVVPPYSLAVVPVDPVDFAKARAGGSLGPDYELRVHLLKGGDFIDSARVDFSECQVRIRRPIGLSEQGVTKYEYTFSVERSGIPDGATYTWSFPDGGTHGTGETVTHAFENPGSFAVQVRASWPGGEARDRTVMVIAPDKAEAPKEEVSFFVFRYFKNKMGKSKQACNNFTIQILRDNKVVDSGVSIARNGDFTITLPVGTGYGYKVKFAYPEPHADSGNRTGNFTVVKGALNFIQVETPPFEAFDR